MRGIHKAQAIGALLAAAGIAASAWAGDGIDFRTVALSFQRAPGTETGRFFGSFPTNPTINALGRVAFFSTLTGSANTHGYWSDRYGSLELVQREGNQAGGLAAGVTYNGFVSNAVPLLNDSGQIAFKYGLAGTGVSTANNTGVWVDTAGTQELIVRKGQPVEGAALGVAHGGFSDLRFNNDGRIAVVGGLTGTGITGANDRAIFVSRPGGMDMVVQEGQAPEFTQLSAPSFSNSGAVAFGSLDDGVGAGALAQVWTNRTGSLQQIHSGLGALPAPVINGANDVAFRYFAGQVAPGIEGYSVAVLPGPGSAATPPSSWPSAPDLSGDGVVVNPSIPVLNSLGHVAFTTQFAYASGLGMSGIVADGPTGASIIAMEGMEAPGAEADQVFAAFRTAGSPLGAALAINDLGNVIFTQSLTGPGVTAENDVGLWIKDEFGLRLVLREGDMLDVNNDPAVDDLRTVSQFFISTPRDGEYGQASSFNNNNQIAARVYFTNGSSAIMVIAVPAPGSAALLGVCGVIGLRRRRG